MFFCGGGVAGSVCVQGGLNETVCLEAHSIHTSGCVDAAPTPRVHCIQLFVQVLCCVCVHCIQWLVRVLLVGEWMDT